MLGKIASPVDAMALRISTVNDESREAPPEASCDSLVTSKAMLPKLEGAGLPGSRDHTLVVLMAGTGLRLNEVRELRVGDLHLRECNLTVRAETSKFRKSRTVDFHDAVAREVDRYLRSRPTRGREDSVIASDEGTLFSDHGLDKVFQRIRERSGVTHFSAHILRHTWATNYMRQPGANLLEPKRQGGWSTWEQLERYSHAVPVKDRRTLPNPLERTARSKLGSLIAVGATSAAG